MDSSRGTRICRTSCARRDGTWRYSTKPTSWPRIISARSWRNGAVPVRGKAGRDDAAPAAHDGHAAQWQGRGLPALPVAARFRSSGTVTLGSGKKPARERSGLVPRYAELGLVTGIWCGDSRRAVLRQRSIAKSAGEVHAAPSVRTIHWKSMLRISITNTLLFCSSESRAETCELRWLISMSWVSTIQESFLDWKAALVPHNSVHC
jgi:hypothetical protein